METMDTIYDFTSMTEYKSTHHPHPTLREVRSKMKGFDESLIMYMYHHLNGREGEAQTYLEEWREEQDAIYNELRGEVPVVSPDNVKEENEYDSREHPSSEPNHHIEE